MGVTAAPPSRGANVLQAVVLDMAAPLASRADILRLLPSADRVFATTDALGAEWLASELGTGVEPTVSPAVAGALQMQAETFAREHCRHMEMRVDGVDLGPSGEYLFLLGLVGVVRDAMTLDSLARSNHSVTSVTLLADRARSWGLTRALRRLGLQDVEIRSHATGVRYVDKVLQMYPELPRGFFWRPGRPWRKQAVPPRESFWLATPREASLLQQAKRGASVYVLEESLLRTKDAFRGVRGSRILRAVRDTADRLAREAAAEVAKWLSDRLDARLSEEVIVDLCEDYLAPGVSASLQCAAAAVHFHKKVLESPHLRGVLVWNDVLPQYRVLVDAAHQQRVGSVMLQHGVFALRTMHDRPRTDLYAVWGPSGQRWLESVGVSANRVGVVGAPYLKLSQAGRTVKETHVTVVYASQPSTGFAILEAPESPERILFDVAAACERENMRLIAKPHPTERSDVWGQEVLQTHPDVTISLDTPMSELVALADVLVTRSSTSTIEALAAGVPVVVYEEASAITGANPYADLEGVHVKREQDDLGDVISRALADRGRDFGSSVFELAGEYGPSAAPRLADAMEAVEMREEFVE
jgi:hypothetical protein